MGAHELAFVGLAGSGVGTALAVPMVWPSSRRTLDVRLLGSVVLLMSAIAALISARLAGLVAATPLVEHGINVLGLCAFPVLVVYTRHATDAPIALRRAAWWWLPAAVYAVVAATRTALGVDSRVRFAWLLPLVLGFTAVSLGTLWSRTDERRSTVVPAEWIVAFVAVLNVAQIVRMFFADVAVIRAVVPLVLSTGFIALGAFAVWRTVATRAVAGGLAAAPRYERSGLEESLARELLRRIDDALDRDRLFACPDLTLGTLAAAVSSTPHQMSEVLNRYAGVSFHDMINRRRVDDVKAQLLDPASDRFTIEGIGASAGFGSRSALYAAFRRFEGMTPSAYRAARRNS